MSEEVKSPFGYEMATNIEGRVFQQLYLVESPVMNCTPGFLGIALDATMTDEDIVKVLVAGLPGVVGFFREYETKGAFTAHGMRRSFIDRFETARTYVVDGEIQDRAYPNGRGYKVMHWNGQDFPFNPNQGDELIRPSELQ